MTKPRGVTTHWSGGSNQADITLPVCLPGDLLVILVGGGNQVVATPAGWTAYGSLTGQEAQGKRFTKTADGSESEGAVSIFFDGTDQRFVVALAVRDWDEHALNDFERIGTAGGTYPAGDHVWDANTYQGDLLVTFVFARNAATAPTMGRGVLWKAEASSGSSAALYLESAPAYEVASDFAITYPERSGHVSYSMAVYGFTWTDFQQDPDFEYVQQQLLREITATTSDNDSETSTGGYPTITQDTFLDSQAAQVFDPADSFVPASWTHDRESDIVGEVTYTRSWTTRRRYHLYVASLTDEQLGVPVNDLAPVEGYETLEFESEAQVVQVWSNAGATDTAFDNTDGGSGIGLLPSSFATVLVPATGVTWNEDGTAFADDWDNTYLSAPLIHVRAGQTSAGSADLGSLDVTAALDDSARARVAVAAFVTGPDGTGDPAINLRSYTFEGTAEFGAVYAFSNKHEEDPDSGLHWIIRPGRVRYLVRRSPVVDIIPALIRALRNYPRDDTYGPGGGVARNYPPARRGRNYGQQP